MTDFEQVEQLARKLVAEHAQDLQDSEWHGLDQHSAQETATWGIINMLGLVADKLRKECEQ